MEAITAGRCIGRTARHHRGDLGREVERQVVVIRRLQAAAARDGLEACLRVQQPTHAAVHELRVGLPQLSERT